jgi:hypothetical protein
MSETPFLENAEILMRLENVFYYLKTKSSCFPVGDDAEGCEPEPSGGELASEDEAPSRQVTAAITGRFPALDRMRDEKCKT